METLQSLNDQAAEFFVKLQEVSQENLWAELRGVNTGNPYYQIFDEDGDALWRVPINTPPESVVSAWRFMIHRCNQMFKRGEKAALKSLYEKLKEAAEDD